MNESEMTRRVTEATEGQARRAQRGIVAGYIHELSQRHDNTERPALGLTSKPR